MVGDGGEGCFEVLGDDFVIEAQDSEAVRLHPSVAVGISGLLLVVDVAVKFND